MILRAVIALMVLLPICSGAKSLYVSTTGSDATTYANNDIDNPWASPQEAWYNAAAGDTVFFRAGTYTITTQINTKFNGNSGTAGSPIVFRSYPGEQATFASYAITGTVFLIEKDYNHVYDIDFTGNAATWFHLGYDVTGEHFEVSYCNVSLGTGGDNTGFVLTTPRSDYLVLEYCTIEGPGLQSEGYHGNTSCIFSSVMDYGTIRYNTLHNAPIGIYFKHANDENSSNVISNNYIYNCDRYSIETNSQYAEFSNNIIGADCGAFRVNEANGSPMGDNNTISHNTIMSGGILLSTDDTGADNNTITNNIISSYTNCCDGNTWDYNLYVSGSAIGANDIANQSPTFTTTPQVDPADFVLDAASYGYGGGSDGEDVGADAANVGSGSTPTITAPTNLTATKVE